MTAFMEDMSMVLRDIGGDSSICTKKFRLTHLEISLANIFWRLVVERDNWQ